MSHWTSESSDYGVRFVADAPDENFYMDIFAGSIGMKISMNKQSIQTYGGDNWFGFGEESFFSSYLSVGSNNPGYGGILIDANGGLGTAGLGWYVAGALSQGLRINGALLDIVANGKSITIGGVLGTEALYVSGDIASEGNNIKGFNSIQYDTADGYKISIDTFRWINGLKRIEVSGYDLKLTELGINIVNTDDGYVKRIKADLSDGGATNSELLDIADVVPRQEGSLTGRFNLLYYSNFTGSGNFIVGHQLIHTGSYIDDSAFESELLKLYLEGNDIHILANASDTNFGKVYFRDKYLSSEIELSETGVTGFDTWFTKNSIVGNINELATNKWTIKRGTGAPESLNNDEIYIDETSSAEKLYVNTPDGVKSVALT